ncbi:MAG: hypothetical protein CL910_12205 [Deltaproteobacteria bacterium]|nr:hypothetical protein [Deltaproteobacteria bacterium]
MLSRALLLVLAGLLLSGPPIWAQGSVTVMAPPDLGESFSPGFRLVSELPGNYVEEEFILSGQANLYTYAEDPVPDELEILQPDVPWTTRIIVRRPPDPADFGGSVVVEWWNSTAGFDTAPVWDPSAEFFVQEGWIYVGVTNSTTSIDHLVEGCALFGGILPATCTGRYASLSLPENGVAFEMVSQIAALLKSQQLDRPIPLDYGVERLYHSGQSQQGGSMITYATAFHDDVNDGYFVQAASGARPINFGTDCADPAALPYPDCTPRLQGDDSLVATDLPVPVFHAMTETDVPGSVQRGARQADTPTYRYYEMTGVAHTTVHEGVEVIPSLFGQPPLLLEDVCLGKPNTSADGPVFGSYLLNAMWASLDGQVRSGRTPPHGELMVVDGAGALVRDGRGNALGGIRLPAIEVPIAAYTGNNVVNPTTVPGFLQPLLGLFCFLTGTVTDFDHATLATLYQDNDDYARKVKIAAQELRAEGFLLKRSVDQIIADAEAADIMGESACGLGAELALVLLPWAAWRRRRSRA